MSFDILREFDSLYAQRSVLQPAPTNPSSSSFSFFDSLKDAPSNPQAKNTHTSSNSVFGDGLLSPQRPSSVQLSIPSAHRGLPHLMTWDKPKPNPVLVDKGSSFNDLIGLFDAPISVLSPINNPAQPSINRQKRINKQSSDRDPFAALAVKTLPFPTKPSTFWARKPPPIPQQEEVDDDFGDFADASNSSAPTVPSRALQDNGNGFRRSLPISAHSPSGNYNSTSASVAANPIKNNLNPDIHSAFSLFDTEDFANTTLTTAKHNLTLQSNTTSHDDDFGDFIASPIKSEFPISNSPFDLPPPILSPVTNSFSQIPLTLPTPATTPLNAVTNATTKNLPSRLPLSTILIPFSTIFSQPTIFLFSKLTSHQYPLRQRILSHHKTREFLLGTCEAARVAGRIIAGRRARKLKRTNLGDGDREVQKQDREISELVRIWKEDCLGRLKATIITPTSSSRRKHAHSTSDPTPASPLPNASRVPELEVDMHAQKVSMIKLGFSILDEEDKECLLCGLKRDEVVARLCEHELDGARWWVNAWGHRGCLRWWEEWEGRLLMDASKGERKGERKR